MEKHADFLRDFRGDTVHPSTLDVLDEIGLGLAVQRLPGRRPPACRPGSTTAPTRSPTSAATRAHPYILFLPQWDLLDLLAGTAEKLPTFTLLRSTEVVGVLRNEAGRVTGVRAVKDGQELKIEAGLTVACDGRGSSVRAALGWRPLEHAAPMDVLWFRLPKPPGEPELLDLRVTAGGLMLQIDRGDYLQCAYVVPKNASPR